MAVLQINGLTKRYGAITAVSNLSLQIGAGEVYGILGPNGSGKTTTLGSVLGIIRPNGGTFTWFDGKYGDQERMHIGSLLETPNFYPYLSPVKNLEITAHIKRIASPKIDTILELVNLAARRDSAFSTFSFGMKQRLAIAAALIGDPEVLIFDEPTNGLDPQGIAEVREIIHRIAGEGKTIIMASHILDEVEKVCSHVAIIKRGNLLASGEVGAILSNDRQVDIGAEDLVRLREVLANFPGVNSISEKGKLLQLQVDQALSVTELNKLAFDKGLIVSHLVMKPKSLESEFLEITSGI
ncbi:MAG: ATP-binding cassette domain-containing protein [Saprospiraceae bacterium]|nr:ATP-binding cassette domain-containing protein [Saprospiraceae bacterium]MCF8248405.1 ATP-binding cassette domain-containing protein [Saprospiraceae bacterium]MCF8280076.1 ATP-binding cassette domain-containing protein [Bacteroidales bacterium]MCF8309933.1 ATP-binding cassette domain-containing protein [Saprospiraceae bacterium]MCF8438736.1 ATP-binding cassette domain-containing protein [Saprospiraceae bacterium]